MFQDLKGPVSKKMAKKGISREKHFDEEVTESPLVFLCKLIVV